VAKGLARVCDKPCYSGSYAVLILVVKINGVTHPRRGMKFFDFLKGKNLPSWFLMWKVREPVRLPGQGSEAKQFSETLMVSFYS
jgi:hypothetical protein